MIFYITAPDAGRYVRYFPAEEIERLKKYGEVRRNPYGRPMTREELRKELPETDVLITHWSTPQVDEELLSEAPNLKLLAHCAGTVAHIASEKFYDLGIPVISANSIMAGFVSEATLGFMLAATHRTMNYDAMARSGAWDRGMDFPMKTLYGAEIGLVGLGTVGRKLLPLLAPFQPKVKIYDPYITPDRISEWPFAELTTLETVMHCPIVSVHAAQTPETYHMVSVEELSMMPDQGILINTARGSLVDVEALLPELRKKRLYAVLDVFEKEGEGLMDPRLIAEKENLLLQPHKAAAYVGSEMTTAIFDDIERFLKGDKLAYEITRGQYRFMTQE